MGLSEAHGLSKSPPHSISMQDTVYSSLNSFTLLIQRVMGCFAFQSTDPDIPIGTGKSTLEGQQLLQFYSLIPHENFGKEMFCLRFIDEEIKHPNPTLIAQASPS